MAAHGLGPPRWAFRWGRGVAAIGRCTVRADGTGVITLSLPWARAGGFEWEAVRQWALHEIAHALVGPDKGHGPEFVAACRAVGCALTDAVSPVYPAPPLPYAGECGACRARFGAGRASKSPTRCPACGEPSITWSCTDARELR